MIILDTTSSANPPTTIPDERVIAWLDTQAVETLYLSSVTVGELRYGIAAMPGGRRRDESTPAWMSAARAAGHTPLLSLTG